MAYCPPATAERAMRSVMVVAVLPVLGHTPDFGQRGEDVAIRCLGVEGAVEALDVGCVSLTMWPVLLAPLCCACIPC